MEAFSDRSVDKISDGECQRVMIARALAQQTPVILLDEPTSFIDLPGRYDLCALLRSLTRDYGKTIVFSTHELDLACANADWIVHVSKDDNGRPIITQLPAQQVSAGSYIKDDFKSF